MVGSAGRGWGGKARGRLIASCTFFADNRVVLVVGVVCISEPSVWSELKFKELVTELALVAHIIPNVEVAHLRSSRRWILGVTGIAWGRDRVGEDK